MGNRHEDCRTSVNIDITRIQEMPLVDAHMHIQSNDIAPLPSMFGVLNLRVSRGIYSLPLITNCRTLHDRMNFTNLSYIPEKNGYSQDLTQVMPASRTGLIVQDFSNGNIEIRVENAINELNTFSRVAFRILQGAIVASKNPFLITLAALLIAFPKAAEIKLNAYPEKKRRALADLLADILGRYMPYGRVARHNSFFIAGIYKNHAIMNSRLGRGSRMQQNGAFSEEEQADARADLNQRINERADGGYFTTVSRHYYENRFFNISFSFEKSVILGMELMYAHYWGAYGIPIYIRNGNNGQHYTITNNLRIGERRLANTINDGRERVFCAYDIPRGIASEIPQMERGSNVGATLVLDNERLGKENGEKYCHFLKPVPETELDQYEDLEKYNEYTKAATIKWPLQFFPFYHIDPRRFFAPHGDYATGDFRISRFHDFYLCDEDGITEMPEGWIEQNMRAEGGFGWRYGMDFNTEVALDLLRKEGGQWQSGLFWGIKMYAALGYPPYLFDTPNAKKAFRCLQEGDYAGLLAFYNYCAERQIPITCHGSPQGMTIADPGIYLKEYLKDNARTKYGRITNVDFPLDGRTFMNGIGLVDSFSSPHSWRLVLDKLDGENRQRLILCLAHFGGNRYFDGSFEDASCDSDTPYRWLDAISDLIKEFAGVYTDLSCFTYDDVVQFPSMISRNLHQLILPRVERKTFMQLYRPARDNFSLNNGFVNGNRTDGELADVARVRMEFVRASIERTVGTRLRSARYKYEELAHYRGIAHTAKTLKGLIKATPQLRHRIMFGTDWPMTEMNAKGVLRYNSAIFVMLQVLTEELNNEWDAWHQFAVINPLRFLGLLKDEPAYARITDDKEEHTIDMSKIDAMKGAIEQFIDDIEKENSDEYNENFMIDADEQLAALKAQHERLKAQCCDTIPAAHKMKRGDRLLLTNGQQGTGAL
jgi:hypothetical protein